MKAEFSNFNQDHLINVSSIFFLFGNYRKSFEVFCDFVAEKLKSTFSEAQLNTHYCSVLDCSKIIEKRCDLFGSNIDVFCLRGVEDSHLDKLQSLFSFENCVFILEAGDFRKAKNITDYFTKSRTSYAIPSFKNDMTLMSLCRLFLPKNTSVAITRKILELLNGTDEPLGSFFRKIGLLLQTSEMTKKENESNNTSDLLQQYVTYKSSFIQNMEFIPIARFFMKQAIKEKIGDKKQQFIIGIDFSQEHIIEKLLNAEIRQKIGTQLTKTFLFN